MSSQTAENSQIGGRASKAVNCACCGSSKSNVFAMSSSQDRRPLTRIVQCKQCGFLYADPRPSLAELEHLYSGYEIQTQWARGSEFFNSQITSLVASVTPAGGQILEVGCSYGKILHALQQKGFLVQGVEASSRACQYIRKEYDFPVYEGFVESYLETILSQQRFDTIIALNVVEHLRDPYATLSKLNGILVRGGHVVIVVPDVALALLVGWVRKRLHGRDPYGVNSGAAEGPVAFNSPGHLSFLSRKTVYLLVTRVGWKVIEHRHAPYVLSGDHWPTRKDLVKRVLYHLARPIERLGLTPMGLSYSQLLLTRKTY